MLIAIARGRGLRQLGLLGIQIGVLTGLLLKFASLPAPTHTHAPHLSLKRRCQAVIVTLSYCSFVQDLQHVCCLHTRWSPESLAAISRHQEGTTITQMN